MLLILSDRMLSKVVKLGPEWPASLNAFYPRFTVFCGKPEELLVSISLSENLGFSLIGEKLGGGHFMTGGMSYPCKWGSR